ncbi:unnamed protein product [Phytophthora fragariaefolia]|uniref:Unnamed protein product n=1 Tax=Phytophthora fragariaefolia TaxID=1490495 RepID=A0A9W6Y9W0_9STRA|nr:unnamed protein product [Phytophthora fragariaefolia]
MARFPAVFMQIDDIDPDRDDADLKDKHQISVPLMTQTTVVFAFTLPGTGYTLVRPMLHQDIEYPKIEVNPDTKIAWPGVCQPSFQPTAGGSGKQGKEYIPPGNLRPRSTSACEFRSKEPKIDNSTIPWRSE